MSKSATVAATIVMTSAVQGEQIQIDIGPYATANINVSPNVVGSSPGAWLIPTGLAAGNASNNVSLTNTNITPLPIYLVISPLQSTAGTTLTVQGASADVGVQVSSTLPSFIPAQSQNIGESYVDVVPPVVWIKASANCQLELGWV